ncbi:DNA-binding response regulator [Leptolyngbya sp. BL0902]|uniref:response regulator transcription factor n=1 Tax=Leptolyngbya sp. BL0902 TaxID=1115757 RepID=UPI0018E6ED50|nr:response regulator [Leptolyngbya sp. BL0902]QQE64549.1 DNA-binding response regulator [Leptolyngbya sp. BL0902]
MSEKTILVIEDEAQTRNIFLKCLEFEGFHAVGASDGTSGVSLAQQHRPHLVVCDIMMPDMDGYAVLSALRKSRQTTGIPLIFLTAKVTMADLRRGMELGADDYLTKPCTVDQFLAAINTRLQRQDQLSSLYDRGGIASLETPYLPAPGALSPLDLSLGQGDREPSKAGDSSANQPDFFPNDPKLTYVFQFIEAHFCQPISLKDVAQAAGYSPAYLTSLVQTHTGRTVKQWIIERRMAQARYLLTNTNQSVRAIAEAAGYGDAGYFTRQFRQFHGVSPQFWRQNSVA